MKYLIAIILVAGLVWAGTTYYERNVRTEATDGARSVMPFSEGGMEATPAEVHEFACDGREYCSQMNSCEEAEYFLANCPNVKMDGGGDGVPCERQWCKD